MSTILEALKKSEQERKLNSVPTLSDMPAPQEASRWPLWGLFTLLSLLLIVCIFMLIRFWPSAEPQAKNAVVISNESLAERGINSQNSGDGIVVNVVSYSQTPGQSFAMINGKMYRENEFIRAGLKIESIEVNKVILNLRGRQITRTP